MTHKTKLLSALLLVMFGLNVNAQDVQHIKTYGPGIQLSPWIVNISVGYSFSFKKKNI